MFRALLACLVTFLLPITAAPETPDAITKQILAPLLDPAKVAAPRRKGIKTIQQIAKDFDIHPVQVSDWKKAMTDGATGIFGTAGGKADPEDFERQRDELHAKIGQLTVEVDFLRKKSKQLGL